VRLKTLVERAYDKNRFESLQEYIAFGEAFLETVQDNLQAEIVCQNENHYRFWQYKRQGNFNITRPLNANLMYSAETFDELKTRFLDVLKNARNVTAGDARERGIIRNSIYTLQQCIGAALDALPAGKSNNARKVAGDLFERLIRLLIRHLGVECRSGIVKVPVQAGGEAFTMTYQHDLVLKMQGRVKVIGSVKTSSKDRIDKIFIDKFLFNKITESYTPHVAIFLNDVQRRKKNERTYRVASTFPGALQRLQHKIEPARWCILLRYSP